LKQVKNELNAAKKHRELCYKKIEAILIEAFKESKHPYWLTLILIENSKDYRSNKYNSLASFIAKSFEKWIKIVRLTQSLDDELRLFAFLVSTRHHLLMIESITNSYNLSTNNEFLVPYLKKKCSTLDHKDKAILISTLELHDHFNFEEVTDQFCLSFKIR
jgi:hypothetical protein